MQNLQSSAVKSHAPSLFGKHAFSFTSTWEVSCTKIYLTGPSVASNPISIGSLDVLMTIDDTMVGTAKVAGLRRRVDAINSSLNGVVAVRSELCFLTLF